MLASSFYDLVLGIDIHFEMVPTPAPVPVPIPNPFTGMVFDPIGLAVGLALGGAISLATGGAFHGPVIYWGFAPANVTGTSAMHIPGHILIPPGVAWAPFPKTPKPFLRPGETPKPALPIKPENDAVMITGSKTVHVMGTNAVRLFDLAMSCSEPVRLPSSIVLAVPKGALILIGGPPALDIMAAATASLRTRFVSDSLHSLLSRMSPGRLRSFLGRAVCFFTGHPVDVATGKVLTSSVDVDLQGPLPLKIERVYMSSFAARSGPLGHGWSHSLDRAVWEERGKVVYLAGDGREIEFDTFDLPGHRMRPGDHLWHAIDRLTLRCEAEGCWTIQEMDGSTLYFGPVHGRDDKRAVLRRIVSSSGHHQTELNHDRRGLLEWVRDSSGRDIHFEYDGRGRLLSLALPTPTGGGWYIHRRYDYDDHGNLVGVTDANGQRWRYEYVTHLLTRETDRAGMSFYFEYDGFGQDAWCIRTWGDGGVHDHVLNYDKRNKITYVTDSLGQTKQYHMNAVGAVVKLVDALGAETKIEYDDALRTKSVTDPIGGVTRMEWDTHGNCVRATRPDGAQLSITYDQRGRPVESVDFAGGVWQRRYDARGLLHERVDPLGRVLRMSYNGAGLLSDVVDHNGARTVITRDRAGHVVAVRDAMGLETYFTRDRLGRLTGVRDALGVGETRRYDAAGWLVEAVGSDGTRVQFTRDPEGNVTNAASSAGALIKTAYEGFRRRTVISRPSGDLRLRHDTEGRVVEVRNPAGEVQTFEYDACGRVSAVTRFDGRRWEYQRDAKGRITKMRRPSGGVVERVYDEAGRVAEMKYPDGTSDLFKYRADGALLEATNADASIKFERDILGQVLREWQDEHWIDSRYDEMGNRVEVSSSLGAREVIERGLLGEVESLCVNGLMDPWRVDFRRDTRGAEVERRLPGGVVARWERDPRGRPIAHRMLRDDVMLDKVEYHWAAGDRISALLDASGRGTVFSRNEAWRATAARFADGEVQHRVPDLAGNIYRRPDGAGHVYGPGGELRENAGVKYAYDRDGRCIERRLPDGTKWGYRYDGAGRLVAVCRPDGSHVTFGYDALGRRVVKDAPEGTTRWVWDRAVPLHELSSDGPPTTWLFEPGTFAPLGAFSGGKRYGIVTDHIGAPAAAYDEAGQVAWQAQLDLYGVPRHQEAPRARIPWRFPGQYEDVETGLFYNRHRYYEPSAGRYLTPDPLGLGGGGTPYGYVSDPTAFTDPLGLEECTDFYHGTTQDDAERIMQRGIKLEEGRLNLDFNPFDEGAFYVTRDADQAATWAEKAAQRTGGEPAVVQFSVPNSELAALETKTFQSADSEWADFVRNSRSGAGGPEHHGFDIVEGPFVTNPKAAENPMSSELLRGRGNQVAVCSPQAARVFNNAGRSIVE